MDSNKLCPRKTTQFKKYSSRSKKRMTSCLSMREDTVFKKACELSTLCNVEVCVIYYGRDGELIKTWPEDKSKVRDMAERFSKLSHGEKRKKSTNLSQFLAKKINDEKNHDISKFSEKVLEMEDSLQRHLSILQDKLQNLCSHVHQTEPCGLSTDQLSPLNIVHHKTELLTNHYFNCTEPDQNRVVYPGFPSVLSMSSSSPTNFSLFLLHHDNGAFTQLAPTFNQPAIPQNNNLLGTQGLGGLVSCNNIPLAHQMQIQNPLLQFGQYASWNQTTFFGDPVMSASYL